MKIYTLNGAPVNASNSLLGEKDLGDLGISFTHVWDSVNAETYIPSATEQSYWSRNSTPRVSIIPDTGTDGTKPFEKDTGIYSGYFSYTEPYPGPLYIPSSTRFRGRPGMKFDLLVDNGGSFDQLAMLTPNRDAFDSQYYFNGGAGYDEYWMVFLCQALGCIDSTLGSTIAGPTIGTYPPAVGGNNCWGVSSWTNFSATPIINCTVVPTATDTTGIIHYKSANGTNSRLITVTRRTDGSALIEDRTGNQNDNPSREMFVGWTDHHDYWSCGALKIGAPTTTEISTVKEWLLRQIPTSASHAAEP